jgi:hypothetical protein
MQGRPDCSVTARHLLAAHGSNCSAAAVALAWIDHQRQGNRDTLIWISRARERKRCGAFIDVHTGGAPDDVAKGLSIGPRRALTGRLSPRPLARTGHH